MHITLNGDPKKMERPLTLEELLNQLGIPAGRVACEVNLKIIKRAFYTNTVLQEGDTVEIIHAIGGG
jgi:thiamine biosynthesis protein ThiS